MIWSTKSELREHGRAKRVEILKESSPVSYADVLKLWRDDAEFRLFFTQLLADAPYTAFRWETPPITRATAERPFEFVLLDSPGLARTPDRGAFAEHFRAAEPDDGFVSFANLGNDAVLVVPCPVGPQAAYGHLAAFVREAPEPQRTSVWRVVGQQMDQRLGAAPIWLSTAGAGVSWLHVRIDNRPKYYGFMPYRTVPVA